MTTLDAGQWLEILALGAAAGAMGQVLRTIVGLKKASDEASAKGVSFADEIQPWRLVMSLLIGAAAGAVAALSTLDLTDSKISVEQVLALLAAGYAGADFLEGFTTRFNPVGKAVTTPAMPQAPDGTVG